MGRMPKQLSGLDPGDIYRYLDTKVPTHFQ